MCGIVGFFVPCTRVENVPARLRRMAQVLSHRGPGDHGIWHDPSMGIELAHARLSVIDLSPEGHQPMHLVTGRFAISFFEKMLLADTRSYMLDDILTKVDRVGMAVSLEARVPLLDHRIYEAAWRLPMPLRLCQSITKVALRELLGRRLPRHLFERPKMGFGVPLSHWLRHKLRDWAESLLQPSYLEDLGLNAQLIRQEWERMLTTKVDLSSKIWCVLMLRSWFDRWGKT